ncbi:MAG TPA: aminotransferase class III-fold pyridoxal phosphate-dependent enzyme [Bacteroidales bacterium]|nr:aminotransferase class III-fold pyridoxal phosphate-dependent enzyme [Bacteroidales bacterium]HPD22798.1 aminotransferase class III-fold pyridoxal phosphate-dependent enzyme [Bacteroidales bacterium]HRS98939.1 aminotransferase class III-fold pyridoxal phosphate-dependent enzyme [Bacteroidales bacterium]HRT80078.1 aminotransferase class III-fold pyridoxal phosphate-dependent enzyme [Bacteroidales bacterium]
MKFPDQLSRNHIAELKKYVIVEPYPFSIDLKNSREMFIQTVEGEKIFDWTGLYGSKLLGYNHPGMFEKEYIEKLIFAANNKMPNPDFLTPECLEYYRLLHEIAPRCMKNEKLEVYSVNSGAEAVENMMKYFINIYNKRMISCGKPITQRRFIYFDQAFHGRTVFALNVTVLDHDPILNKDFKGIIPGNLRMPFPAYNSELSYKENLSEMKNSLSALEYAMKTYQDEIVGLILEPLQGAGGQRHALPEFYTELSKLCKKYNILWGLDEVQTAGGQTGEIFAIDLFDIPYPPNAVATAKKFGNGVVYMIKPMEDIGVLDSTWGGTLADMVRFVQEWKIVRNEKLIEQIPEKTEYLKKALYSLKEKYTEIIYNIRGLGIYQGFSLKEKELKSILIEKALQEQNLLLLGAGPNTIRLRPPLDMSFEDVDLLHEKLDLVLKTFKSI